MGDRTVVSPPGLSVAAKRRATLPASRARCRVQGDDGPKSFCALTVKRTVMQRRTAGAVCVVASPMAVVLVASVTLVAATAAAMPSRATSKTASASRTTRVTTRASRWTSRTVGGRRLGPRGSTPRMRRRRRRRGRKRRRIRGGSLRWLWWRRCPLRRGRAAVGRAAGARKQRLRRRRQPEPVPAPRRRHFVPLCLATTTTNGQGKDTTESGEQQCSNGRDAQLHD